MLTILIGSIQFSNANKLGNDLYEYLVDKELTVINNAEPTRKDKIIDLTIVSNRLVNKIRNGKYNTRFT